MTTTLLMMIAFLSASQPAAQPRYRHLQPSMPQAATSFNRQTIASPYLRFYQPYQLPVSPINAYGFRGYVTPSGYDPYANPYFQMSMFYLNPTIFFPQSYNFQQINVYGNMPQSILPSLP